MTIEDLLSDYPIFQELSRDDLLLTIAVIALSQTDQEEAFGLLPELPHDLDAAINFLSFSDQMRLVEWMSERLQNLPPSCDYEDRRDGEHINGISNF